ncbi:MAG: hypothetical protein CMH56_11365 [Myxococcales bacterium]|nr:hypothetical protein [Myxococcales bacterium]
MVFGLGRKKDEAAAQTQAPQMSPAAMEMLQQAATGAPAAGQAMAPSMTPGMEQAPPTSMAPSIAPSMAPSMAQPAAAAAFPPAGAAEMPSFTPAPEAAPASGRTAKPSREEKKAAAAARKEMKLLEKRRKKGSKARFSRARYLREANGNAAAGLALSILLLIATILGPVLLNFSVLIPQTRENQEIVSQVQQYNDILAQAQPLLEVAIKNKTQREQAIAGRLGAFGEASAVTGQLRQLVNDLEAANAQIIDEASRTVVNSNLGIGGLTGKTVTLKMRADFLSYLLVRNKFMRSQQSVNVSNERVAASEGDPIVDIEVTIVVPARSEE